MKRSAIFVLVGLTLALATPAIQAAEEPDFRNVRWGMSMEEVKAVETADAAEPVETYAGSPSWLRYNVKIGSLSGWLKYAFESNELIRAVYSFDEETFQGLTSLAWYGRLSRLLQQKYGEPDANESNWLNMVSWRIPEYWAWALRNGHVEQWAYWALDRTT